MKDGTTESKREKLREIATFEWLFQQSGPFVRATPTNVKVMVSSLLLLHDFKPVHNCEHNDMNCFLSFPCSLREYLQSWPKNTPFVDSAFSLELDARDNVSDPRTLAK